MKNATGLGMALCLLATSGCVTHITTDLIHNPPPAEKFSSFNRFELAPIQMGPPYDSQEGNEKARAKIQQNVSATMDPVLRQWNEDGAKAGGSRTLLIQPSIREIKFLNATVRVWTGWMSGSSAVILDARITEKETGRVVATPMFYARAAAMSGAVSFGAADNAMLIRIASRLTTYLRDNYPEAVGGITGQDERNK
jgi:hypothetical protein